MFHFVTSRHERTDTKGPCDSPGPPTCLSTSVRQTSVMRNPESFETIQVQSIAGHIGATVEGVDLRSLSEPEFKEIHRALLEYEVIVFPGSDLDDESQMALAHRPDHLWI